MVLGLAALVGAAVFALLPVSVNSVTCNPEAIAKAGDLPDFTPPTFSYRPAILIWLDPSSVTPNPEPVTLSDPEQAVCQSAALSQLTPAFVLGGVGLALLVFGALIVGYVMTGRPRSVAGPLVLAPGWYSDPSGSPNLRWWDGQAWTAAVQPPSPPSTQQQE